MIVSVKWLEELLGRRLEIEELKRIALDLGMEIEQETSLAPPDVVIGRIHRSEPHPKTKNLRVLTVKTTRQLQIVTAAANVNVNDLVFVVPVGGKLNQEAVLERDFEGTRSMGVLVSEEELKLAEKSTGVVILDKGEEGKKFTDIFDDITADVKVTTNRPDLLSMVGLAREIATGLAAQSSGGLDGQRQVNHIDRRQVKIRDANGCPRYTARIFEDVRVKESPFSLKWRLRAMGMNAISNVVDITNINMLLYGQPLHPFDLDLLSGSIIIRKARKNEEFITLEGTVFRLDEHDMVIADKEGPIALAGIIGAKRAEISHSTRRALLESAYFSPQRIAHTRRRLGIQTEASIRFERGADLSIVDEVSRVTAEQFNDLAQAREIQFVSEGRKAKPRVVKFSRPRLNSILSLNLNADKIKSLLGRNGIKVTGTSQMQAVIPHHRYDLQFEEEIFEEVARLFGYMNIPETPPERWANNTILDKTRNLIKMLREYLIGLGLSETYSISLVSSQRLAELKYPDFVRIQNPLNERYDALRPTMLFGLLDCVNHNLSKGNHSLKLFELGNVLLAKEPFQEKRLGVIMGGEQYPDFWNAGGKKLTYYDAKGTLETILKLFRIKDAEFKQENREGLSQSVRVASSGKSLGYIGCIDKGLCDEEFFYFELFLENIFHLATEPFYIPPGRFPANVRDLSFLFGEDAEFPEINKVIAGVGGPVLEKILLFDYYRGDNLPPGKKSLGFRLYFKAPDRTLNDDEVDAFVMKIVDQVTARFAANLRTKEKH